ncbi:MAG TPA: hypothetical protein VGL81_10210 [Polyangiaceae bacterium]|jgi:hypothetical protein
MPLACGRTPPEGALVARGAPSGSVPPVPSAAPAPVPVPVPVPVVSAGAAAVPPLVYQRYGNPRFDFWVDVPAFFVASPPPTNGDGQQWTWGDRATMTSSGMYASSPTALRDLCDDDAKAKSVTSHSMTATDCWVTGKDAGKIYWQKTRLAKGVFYSLRFEYDESLGQAFDPLVAHVDASWTVAGNRAVSR